MIVDCALYLDGRRKSECRDLAQLAETLGHAGDGDGAFVWLGLKEPEPEELAAVSAELRLHELAAEDAVSAHQRPKLEVYGNSLFLVLKTVRYVDATEDVELGEINVFLGEHFIVVVRHGEAAELASVRRELEQRPDLLALGPSAVVHAVVDRVVDAYRPVLEGLRDDIDEIEYEVFASPRAADVGRIYKLKREVLEALRALRPLGQPLERLASGFHPLVAPDTRAYFRDVQDHVVRTTEQLEDYNELLTSILDANLTQVSLQQNEDMRRISAWVAIAAVPTMLAGVWGMNFEHMPELGWVAGYPLALGIMVLAASTLYRLFRRAGWL